MLTWKVDTKSVYSRIKVVNMYKQNEKLTRLYKYIQIIMTKTTDQKIRTKTFSLLVRLP